MSACRRLPLAPVSARRVHVALLVALGALLATGSAGAADEPNVHRLTLREVVAHVLERHPALATAEAKQTAAASRIAVAEAEGTPRVSLVGQLTRSTGNVVPGATFAMAGIPGVQGPPGASRFGAGAWQSAGGLTASWDVLELVRRPALVRQASAESSAERARSEITHLVVASQAAEAYFSLLEAGALVGAAQASEARTATFHEVVATLAAQKLRPDVDLARAETELSGARIAVERARLGVSVAAIHLAEAMGEPAWTVEANDPRFDAAPSSAPAVERSVHPALLAHEGAAKAADARASVARLGALPRVELVGAAWLRGGGYVLGGGPNEGTAKGLLPDTPNWAVGVVGTWTPTDRRVAVARASADAADAAVQRARATETNEALSTEERVARATMSSAVAIAAETTRAVAAARRAVELSRSRYTQALTNVVEIADAERALANAEREEIVARLAAWRAFLSLQRARGDLDPVVGRLGSSKG